MKDVLLLLSLSVENRTRRVGLYGGGVSLKITYANMKGITRSRIVPACDSAITIYKESVRMLEQIEKRPVRLIGTSIYNLSGDSVRQLSFDDFLTDGESAEQQRLLDELQNKYHLDFAGNLEKIYHGETLHRTVEYMRKHLR